MKIQTIDTTITKLVASIGHIFRDKSTGELLGKELWLGVGDSPDNYEEVAYDEDSETALEESPAQIARQMLQHVDAYLLATANSRGYDSIDSAAKYMGNTINPLWAAEGAALRDWTILVYQECHRIQSDVMAGAMPVPTAAELIAMLPKMAWPDTEG